MADTTPAAQLDELITTTFDKVKPVLADQITNENPLLAALNSKSRVTTDGGLTIRRPVLYAFNDTVGSYAGYDLIDTTPQDGFGYAEYDWKQYAGSVTISGRDERLNAGSSRIIGLLQAKIEQLRLSIEEDLNAMLWSNGTPASATGNSGKDLLSVAHIVGDGILKGHATLGGIDSDADGQSWWRSGVQTGCDLTTLDGVRTMNHVRNARKLAKSKPDFIFADQDVYEAYEALAAPNIRFADVKMADLGFDSVAFHNAEVMFEDDVPADSMYFLNSQYLEFVQHQDAWMKMGEFKSPVNQDAKTALVISMGELVTDVRRAHAVIYNITSS
jgi:hypothetical protein